MTLLRSDVWLRLASPIAIIILWQAGWSISLWDERLFPPPSKILDTLVGDALSGVLMEDLMASLLRAGVGYLAGALIGVLCGVVTGTTRWADAILGSLFQLFRPIPPIAMVPLVVVWFGIGEFSKILLVVIGVVFPVWINTHLGVRAIDSAHLYVVESLRTTYWSRLWNIWLPGAAGAIAAGLRTSVALAFYCLVAAEMAGALYGLAYRIELAHLAYRVDRMIGHMLILGILSFIADAIVRVVLSRLFPWIQAHKA